MRSAYPGTVRKLAQRYWCALCPGARAATTPTQRCTLPGWLSALHGAVTLVVIVLSVVAAVSFAVMLVLTACSGWDWAWDFLARLRAVAGAGQ
jgi:hypothetical protein